MRAIEDEMEKDTEGLTLEEWSNQLKRSRGWMQDRLRRLSRAGKLVVGKRRGTDLTGRPYVYPVYRLKEVQGER